MAADALERRGYELAALRLRVAHALTLPGGTRMRTSYVSREGNAGPLDARTGFPSAELSEGEVVLELPL